MAEWIFPFGETVQMVVQQDRTQKRVFVLGVYASAVHARWVLADGSTAVSALAVASEPCIFWRGDGAEEIIGRIEVPPELGGLRPAAPELNGPSGKALDEMFLGPLGVTREAAWLCDLIPHACLNAGQRKAIEREYVPRRCEFRLPEVTVPAVPTSVTDERRREIMAEIAEADPEVVVLLGDRPIRWFLQHFDSRWQRLSDFGEEGGSYGRLHSVCLAGKPRNVLPLVHPRQAARLGAHSERWSKLHQAWVEDGVAKRLI